MQPKLAVGLKRHGREADPRRPERQKREEEKDRSKTRRRAGAARRGARQRAQREAEREGSGPRGRSEAEGEAGERENGEGGEKGDERVGGGRRRPCGGPLLAVEAEEAGRNGGNGDEGEERGGETVLGGEGEGLAVGVVEVRESGPVDQVPSGTLLGPEAGGNEGVRERARPDAEERPGADHLDGREDADVPLRGRRPDPAAPELSELLDGALAGSRDPRGDREEKGRRRERAPSGTGVEQEVSEDGRGQGGERRHRLGRSEADEACREPGRSEEARPPRPSARHPDPEQHGGEEERRGDVPRVSDQRHSEEARLGSFHGNDSQDAEKALRGREQAGGRPREHQAAENARRCGRACLRGAGGDQSERREDGGGREGVDTRGVRDRRGERENEDPGERGCGGAPGGRKVPDLREGPPPAVRLESQAEKRDRRTEGLQGQLRIAKLLRRIGEPDKEGEDERGEETEGNEDGLRRRPATRPSRETGDSSSSPASFRG